MSHEQPEKLFCWKDGNRQCGADCMAYTNPPVHPDYTGQSWSRCLLLVSEHRKSKHLVVIAETLHKIHNHQVVTSQKQSMPEPPMLG